MHTSLARRLGVLVPMLLLCVSIFAQTRDLTPTPPKLIGSFLHYPSINTDFPGYGFIPDFFSWNVRFTTSARNDGTVNETNVNGLVKMFGINGNLINQLPTGSVQGNLPPGAISHLGTTAPFSLQNKGVYDFEISVLSDSVGQGQWLAKADTVRIVVTDSTYSADFGGRTNEIGSGLIGTDGFGVASFFHLDESLEVGSIEVGLGPNTYVGGVLQASLYDTTGGFNFFTGFANPPVTTVQHVITPLDSMRGYAKFSMATNNELPVMDTLVSRGYYAVVLAETNSGATPVQFINDTTVIQPVWTSLFFDTNSSPRWYLAYASSAMVNAFQIRLNVAPYVPDSATSVHEVEYSDLQISPNPASEYVNIPLIKGARHQRVRIINTFGKLLYEREFADAEGEARIHLNQIPSGVYILTLESSEGELKRSKLIIE
ncbi:MAG: T9SS type A sorting domain-containing protein [Flavobacteriia bacterium]|nr:T9SS type A sorting domain-containing protein [Flavobacteriia bacterium]